MSAFFRLFSRVVSIARSLTATAAVTTVIAMLLFPAPATAIDLFHHKKQEITTARQRKIAAAIADEYSHRFEAFVGGGFMTFRPGQAITSTNPPTGVKKSNDEGVWSTGASYYFSPSIGVTAAVQGQYGEADIGNNGYGVLRPNISQYSFQAGPEYRFYRTDKTAVSAHIYVGTTYGIFDGDDKAIPPPLLGMWSDGFKGSATIGFNIDHNVFDDLALRIQPTGIINTFGGKQQYSYGFNAGFVYRFGRQGENNVHIHLPTPHLPKWRRSHRDSDSSDQ